MRKFGIPLKAGGQFAPVQTRHIDIEDTHVGFEIPRHGQSILGPVFDPDFVASCFLQLHAGQSRISDIIVNEQDSRLGHGKGR
jgi:hypothetical protein